MKVEYIGSGTFVGGEEDAFNMFGDDKNQDCYVLTLTQIKKLYRLGQLGGWVNGDFNERKELINKIIE